MVHLKSGHCLLCLAALGPGPPLPLSLLHICWPYLGGVEGQPLLVSPPGGWGRLGFPGDPGGWPPASHRTQAFVWSPSGLHSLQLSPGGSLSPLDWPGPRVVGKGPVRSYPHGSQLWGIGSAHIYSSTSRQQSCRKRGPLALLKKGLYCTNKEKQWES